jgi:hypothetical protein
MCRQFRQFRLFVRASIGGALPRSNELPVLTAAALRLEAGTTPEAIGGPSSEKVESGGHPAMPDGTRQTRRSSLVIVELPRFGGQFIVLVS